jgi:CO dehydrogenase maturation factor
MRLAFIGKGGSGKSTVAGTVARILARRQPVLALDVDPLPGLAFALGLGQVPDAGLPAELAEREEGKGWVMKESVTAGELVDRYAVVGPDGVRFLQLGKLPHHVHPGSTVAFRHVIESFHRPGWSVVGDLSAGTRQAFFGWASFATRIVLVSEPTPAGLLTVRRLKRLTRMMPEAAIGLVLNKADGEQRTRKPAQELDLPVWSIVPYDEKVVIAERKGLAPIDAAPRSAAVSAIEDFVQAMLALG